MKLQVEKRDLLFRDDGKQVHPYDVLADWVRRMAEAKAADPSSPVYPLALNLKEWEATKTYFAQFTHDAATSPDGEDDPLRGLLVAFGIPIPEAGGEEDDE